MVVEVDGHLGRREEVPELRRATRFAMHLVDLDDRLADGREPEGRDPDRSPVGPPGADAGDEAPRIVRGSHQTDVVLLLHDGDGGACRPGSLLVGAIVGRRPGSAGNPP
jgi:hypothetical protein